MEAITNEEIFDEELCGMVKFEDETKEKPSDENYAATENHKAETKPKKKNEPVDAEYDPVANSWFESPEMKCAAKFLFFAGIEYVVFYWLQSGQMELSAAMPSMIACAFLAGLSIKKNWKWRN